ncbi:MAG: leucine-rich repeat domain-containing protein, partial [Bacteroidales bacterium]|nr:leucine-rich repeat domain-containing protein [Bacteroidales bacterium]
SSAFSGTKIEEIELPSSIKKIEKEAFNSCEGMASITIPNSVKSIGNAAFQNCTALTSVEIPNSLREINYRLFKASGLTEITIPSTVKVIGKEAFADCQNLKTVVIEDGVRKIDNSAFKNTAIEEIEIPATVTEIGTGITPKNTVWIVEKDSYAHQYAVENNMTFRIKNGNQTFVVEQIININIYAHNRTIVVENADDEIFVYDAIGRLIARRDAMHCVSTITVRHSGVYVVRIGNLAKKVIVE